jgi:hypothetical protein
MVAADELGSIRLLDAESHALVGPPFPGIERTSASATFTADGGSIVAIDASGAGFVWDDRVESWMARACEVAGRDLTETEWAEFVPDRPYAKVCP